MMKRYMLYNNETNTIEAYEIITDDEARERNDNLRERGESVRWIIVTDEDEE